jgi:hypothetical protein
MTKNVDGPERRSPFWTSRPGPEGRGPERFGPECHETQKKDTPKRHLLELKFFFQTHVNEIIVQKSSSSTISPI